MLSTLAPDPGLPRWQRSLLPAMIGADHADRGATGTAPLPRSLRDWLVDIVLFLGALLIGAATAFSDHNVASTGLSILDGALGVVAIGSLWVRRRHPAPVALFAIAASAVSGACGGAAIVALFTVAIYRAPRRTLELFALSILTAAVNGAVYPLDHHYNAWTAIIGALTSIAAVAFGAFVRARRELVASLHERNRRLQDEQALRVQEARLAERNRIAREMHDVLAHRISLLSVHAGALEFHPDAPPQEIARAAAVIRESARAAQEELREVVGVLRAETDADADADADAYAAAVEPPQPTYAELARLLAESRAAGMELTFETTLTDAALPATLGRTVYRLLQEALTNARKHAPGELVRITLGGRPGEHAELEVVNRPRVGEAGRPPAGDGAGAGLIGIGERVALAGGTLRSGPLPGGGFRIHATLPWPAR